VLRKHLRAAQSALLYSDHMEGDAVEAMFRHACAMGDRVKRATSRYKSGRCDTWRKVKNPASERR